ncbi:MAM and LDL-receptor class A domain-containing protein 1-like [Eriocheir sinensis]|uniref:MAM and LDL-receptor class A domain-containing protein 1-like n=1 Tax=Eriocheir sinensis TaxID=95602 RepID=UPI0021C98D21|nr:MAM and LDL-receptor class A domain-containing protein 1-like [Eriocheir sinensis]
MFADDTKDPTASLLRTPVTSRSRSRSTEVNRATLRSLSRRPRPHSAPTPPRPSSAPTPPRPSSAPTPPRPSSAPTPPRPSSAPTPPRPSSAPTPPRPSSAPTPPRPSSAPTPPRPSSAPMPPRPSSAYYKALPEEQWKKYQLMTGESRERLECRGVPLRCLDEVAREEKHQAEEMKRDNADLVDMNRMGNEMCDFEAPDLCGFSQREDDTLDWTHGSARDGSGLLNDHTTGDIFGHYMYMDPVPHVDGAVAGLVSPDMVGVQEACVAFSYFTSLPAGEIEVWLLDKESPEPTLLDTYSAPFQSWIGARLSVLAVGVWQVEFRATVRPTSGIVAIDDVMVSPSACPSPVTCDFEANSCLWENMKTAKWTNGRVTDDPALAPVYGHAPPYNHTTGTPYGHYLYFYDQSSDAASATMLSEVFATEKDSCFSFWVHMYGEKVGSLQVKSHEPEATMVLKELDSSLGLQWYQEQINLRVSPQHWLSLDVQGVEGSSNVVAVDDLDLSAWPCTANSSNTYFLCNSGQKIPQQKVTLTHSLSPGLLKEETMFDIFFILFPDPDPEAMPHETYLRVETKDGLVVNKPRIITRHQQQPTSHSCTLYMGYLLQASGADPRLDVYYDYVWSRTTAALAQYPNGTAPASDHTYGLPEGYYVWAPAKLSEPPISTAALVSPALGPPGLACMFSFWYYCKDHYPTLTVTARTAGEVIEELIGDHYDCSSNQEWRQGNLFIGERDTRITVEFQSTKYFLTWTSTQNDITIDDTSFSLCSPNEEATSGDIKCTFSEQCHFSQSHRDSADFIRISYNEDSYMALYGEENKHVAILETLPRAPSIGFCLSFRYKLQGWSSLEVILSKVDKNETVFERQSGFLEWQTYHLNLDSFEIYQVLFVGVTNEVLSRVNLDDLELVEGVCPPDLTCSFDDESQSCRWEDYFPEGAMLPWSFGSGSENISSAPGVDHSWGTAYGHYKYLDLAGNQDGDMALMKSPEVSTTTADGDCFQFWFYLYSRVEGQKVGELGVHVLSLEEVLSERLWQHTYNGQDGWQFGETTIKHETNFSVVLEGLRLGGSESYMAWGDLTVRRGVCADPSTCDFEGGLCGWTSTSEAGDSGWLWLAAEEANNGVEVDHTTETGLGHYITFEKSYCTSAETCIASLRSTDITPDESYYCFVFYLNT